MKLLIFFSIMLIFSSSLSAQSAHIEKIVDATGRKNLVVVIEDGLSQKYFASCSFKKVTLLSDSIKIQLIKELVENLDDTSYCYVPLAPLSHRYIGLPASQIYNTQVAALLLINLIALSSDAIEYCPYPVLYNKDAKMEFSTHGKDLDAVIKIYKRWFEVIKRTGFNSYQLPLVSKKYIWFGSLFPSAQRIYSRVPEWDKQYDCRVFIKQED